MSLLMARRLEPDDLQGPFQPFQPFPLYDFMILVADLLIYVQREQCVCNRFVWIYAVLW